MTRYRFLAQEEAVPCLALPCLARGIFAAERRKRFASCKLFPTYIRRVLWIMDAHAAEPFRTQRCCSQYTPRGPLDVFFFFFLSNLEPFANAKRCLSYQRLIFHT